MSDISSTTEPPVPEPLQRAYARLLFPPSYVVVGAYRFLTDKSLYGPAWDKCRHGVARGATVGFVWACLTFRIQRGIISMFYSNSPRITGLSQSGFFGYHIPVSVPTYAAIFYLSTQLTSILSYFLSRNMRVARERIYAQTVASRGKGPDFWGPYVEEWADPPKMRMGSDGKAVRTGMSAKVARMMSTFVGRVVLKNVIIAPFAFVPFVGLVVSAGVKALATSEFLHRPYFADKKMTPVQVAIFVEERKWEYRAFGFAAALLESLPIVGLAFTLSNRIGAAMWAHDLEKNQHHVAQQLAQGRSVTAISGGTTVGLQDAVKLVAVDVAEAASKVGKLVARQGKGQGRVDVEDVVGDVSEGVRQRTGKVTTGLDTSRASNGSNSSMSGSVSADADWEDVGRSGHEL